MRPLLVIFVKQPRPGRVKSRLARDIGRVEAAWWYRRQTARLLRRLAQDRRWQTALAVTPDAEGLASRVWPAGLLRLPQGPGDLGTRMARVLAGRVVPRRGRPVLVVGSDVPGITAERVAEAFALLGRHDAVIGPAPDGGYWAIGLAAGATLPAGALAGVRWSGPHARADTERTLARLRIGHAAPLEDVDDGADLARVRPRRA